MQTTAKRLKVAFITTVDRNPGDAFIRSGIEYLLHQLIPYYQPIYIDKHEFGVMRSPYGRFIKSFFKTSSRLFSKEKDSFDDVNIIVQAGAPFYYISPGQDGTYASSTSSITTDWIKTVWMERLLQLVSPPPILNMAIGTCQPFFSDASEFNHSPALLEFIKRTVQLSALTTVRETVAARLLEKCDLPSHCLPCTAIFSPDHHRIYPEQPRFVCLNYMPGGAHYTLGQDINFLGWEQTFIKIYKSLRARYEIVVMCHSPNEVRQVRTLLPEAETFFSPNHEDYVRMYARAHFGVLNRVHGAMVLAGFGRPSVIVGNDTRARMGELMELPTYFVNEATPDRIFEHLSDFEKKTDQWAEKLLAIKADARRRYLYLLHDGLADLFAIVDASPGYQRSDFDKTLRSSSQ